MTLRMFAQGTSCNNNCHASCLKVWPPMLIFENTVAGESTDASLPGKAKLPDGLSIFTYNGMPLYTFDGDTNPGAINGLCKNDAWFVVSPDGESVGK